LPSTTTYQLAKDFEKTQNLSIVFKLAQKKVNVDVVMIEGRKTFNGVKGVELGFKRDFMFYLVLAKSLKDILQRSSTPSLFKELYKRRPQLQSQHWIISLDFVFLCMFCVYRSSACFLELVDMQKMHMN
jgi:hypothetical protein